MSENGEYLTFSEALQVLEDPAGRLNSAVLYGLSGASTAEVQSFRRVWLDISPERRQEIVKLLVDSAEANFELDFNALFRVTMEDEDDTVRTLSIEGLWEDDEATLIKPLVRALESDAASSVRAAAASLLGRFVLMAELEEVDARYLWLMRNALLEAIDNAEEHLDVQRRAVESISYLDEDCVREIIQNAYDSIDEGMRQSAVFAMGRSADPAWSRIVLEELENADPAMRYEAARAAGELAIKAAVPLLVRMTSDPDREVQLAAIAALGQIGGSQARRTLLDLVTSDDEVVHQEADEALGELMLGQQPLDLFVYDPHKDEEGEDEDDDSLEEDDREDEEDLLE